MVFPEEKMCADMAKDRFGGEDQKLSAQKEEEEEKLRRASRNKYGELMI